MSSLSIALIAASLFACKKDEPPAVAPARPDVVVVIIDSIRADHMGAWGYDKPTTPRIDEYASKSVLFERAYTTAPWTLPTVATLMTGTHPYVVGIREKQSKVDEHVTTLGELYKANGYRTGAVVSHIYLQPKFGLMQGFDHLDDKMVEGHHEIISSPGVTERALDWVEDQPKDEPIFLVVHYFDPHYDYILHPEIYDQDPDYEGPMESGLPVKKMRQVVRQNKGREAAVAQLHNLYDSEIRYTDDYVGKLLDGLAESRNIDDNALVVIMGDHGEELAERGNRWIGHTKVVSEEVLHVPLIIRPPGGAHAGRRVPEPVSFIDLMPTIAHLSGLPLPTDLPIQGEALDLASSQNYRQQIFAETGRWETWQVVIEGNFKLVVDPTRPSRTPRLYDLEQDPGELKNIAMASPKKVIEMLGHITRWRAELDLAHAGVEPPEVEPTLSQQEEEALRAMGYIE